jgi:hypothetical protein
MSALDSTVKATRLVLSGKTEELARLVTDVCLFTRDIQNAETAYQTSD